MSQDFTPERWSQIEQVFEEVVDLPPAEREQRLRELSVGDKFLQQEVAQLLEHDVDVDPCSDPLQTKNSLLNVGDEVGAFRLKSMIAANRASEVWLALREPITHVDSEPDSFLQNPDFEQHAALKFLRELPGDLVRLKRFRREVGFLRLLRHPGIAELLSVGQHQGMHYFAMRYVEGAQILEYADQHKLNIQQRARLMLQVLDAVSYAHRRKIVHRDLKPSNILVDQKGEARVVDFGISKFQGDAKNVEVQDLTATQERPMTPAYGSPEQFVGSEVSPACDTYALGMVLYELLCGHHPYSLPALGMDAPAASGHLAQPPMPPMPPMADRARFLKPLAPSRLIGVTPCSLEDSQFTEGHQTNSSETIAENRSGSLEELKNKLRIGFDDVVSRALAKDPSDRFSTLEEFRNALAMASQQMDEPTKSGIENWIAYHPKVFGAATGVCGLIVGALLVNFSFDKSIDAQSPSSQSVSEKELARDDAPAESDISKQMDVWRKRTWDLFDTMSTEAILQDHKEILKGLTAEDILAFATHCVRQGRLELALHLYETRLFDAYIDRDPKLNSEAKPNPELLQLAELSAAMRRPTLGIKALGLLSDRSLNFGKQEKANYLASFDESIKIQMTIVRLLLDAGLNSAAFDWSEVPSELTSEKLNLLQVEARTRSGWRQGAKQLLEELKLNIESLTSEEREHLTVLDARLSDPNDAIDKLRAWTDVADASSWSDAMLQTEALLVAAKSESELDHTSEALTRLDRAEELLRRWNQNASCLSYAVSQLKVDLLPQAEGRDYAQATWNRAKESGEFCSDRLMWTVAPLSEETASDTRQEIFQSFAPYEAIYLDQPYLQRMLLRQYGFALLEDEQYTASQEVLQVLLPLEEELLGKDELITAQCKAALSFVEDRLGNRKAAIRLQKGVSEFVSKNVTNTTPAYRFLLPISELEPKESPFPDYRWLYLCFLYRNNDEPSQQVMLDHFARQCDKQFPKAAALLRGQ